MKIEIKMPALKPDMKTAALCAWNVGEGDTIKAGEVMFEVETDKVVSQVEAAADMKITKLLADEGDEVTSGEVIAYAETNEYSL